MGYRKRYLSEIEIQPWIHHTPASTLGLTQSTRENLVFLYNRHIFCCCSLVYQDLHYGGTSHLMGNRVTKRQLTLHCSGKISAQQRMNSGFFLLAPAEICIDVEFENLPGAPEIFRARVHLGESLLRLLGGLRFAFPRFMAKVSRQGPLHPAVRAIKIVIAAVTRCTASWALA